MHAEITNVRHHRDVILSLADTLFVDPTVNYRVYCSSFEPSGDCSLHDDLSG